MADVDGSLEQSCIVGEKNDLELLSQNKCMRCLKGLCRAQTKSS
mgnify:CR=1 FL=1